MLKSIEDLVLLIYPGLYLVGSGQVKEKVCHSQEVLYELSIKVDKPQEGLNIGSVLWDQLLTDSSNFDGVYRDFIF